MECSKPVGMRIKSLVLHWCDTQYEYEFHVSIHCFRHSTMISIRLMCWLFAAYSRMATLSTGLSIYYSISTVHHIVCIFSRIFYLFICTHLICNSVYVEHIISLYLLGWNFSMHNITLYLHKINWIDWSTKNARNFYLNNPQVPTLFECGSNQTDDVLCRQNWFQPCNKALFVLRLWKRHWFYVVEVNLCSLFWLPTQPCVFKLIAFNEIHWRIHSQHSWNACFSSQHTPSHFAMAGRKWSIWWNWRKLLCTLLQQPNIAHAQASETNIKRRTCIHRL